MASDSPTVPAKVRAVAEGLTQPRPMRRGSLSERYVKCNKAGCACNQDADARHGPYYSWTRTVGGRTQSRWIAADQVEQIREQIAAGQQFRQQVEALWAACEQWAETATTSSGEGVEKRGSRRRSRPRLRPKSKR